MICGVVATSISGCDVCTAYRVVCDCTAFVGEKNLDIDLQFNQFHSVNDSLQTHNNSTGIPKPLTHFYNYSY